MPSKTPGQLAHLLCCHCHREYTRLSAICHLHTHSLHKVALPAMFTIEKRKCSTLLSLRRNLLAALLGTHANNRWTAIWKCFGLFIFWHFADPIQGVSQWSLSLPTYPQFCRQIVFIVFNGGFFALHAGLRNSYHLLRTPGSWREVLINQSSPLHLVFPQIHFLMSLLSSVLVEDICICNACLISYICLCLTAFWVRSGGCMVGAVQFSICICNVYLSFSLGCKYKEADVWPASPSQSSHW